MFEIEKVPSLRSAMPSLPVDASVWSRSSSDAISRSDLDCTFLTLGTRRPVGVSMARPMLCEPLKTSSVPSAEMDEFRRGNSARASEVALMSIGISVNLDTPYLAASSLSSRRAVMSASIWTSSQYEKVGTASAAVICLNIALRMPRIGSTRSATTPDMARGGGSRGCDADLAADLAAGAVAGMAAG